MAGWHELSPDPGDELPAQSARGLTWAMVHIPGRPNLPPFILTSTHYINGGWSRGKAKPALRRRLWAEAHERHRALVRAWNSQGLTVIGGGDLNRPDWTPDYTPRTIPIHAGRIDYLWADEAPRGVKIGNISARAIVTGRDNATDHPFVGANLVLRAPRRVC